MNKYLFEDWLRNRLDDLPSDELDRIVAFYLDAIDGRMEDGMTEEEAIHDLGEPEGLLEGIRASLPEYTAYHPVRESRNRSSRRRWLPLVLVLLMLAAALPAMLLVFNASTAPTPVYPETAPVIEVPAVDWADDTSCHVFDAGTVDKIHVMSSLGRVMVEPCDDNQIYVEGYDGSFEANLRGTALYLEDVNEDLLIRLPMAYSLRLTIESDVGDVEIYEITAQTLDVKADLGNIYLHNVSADQRITLTTDVGSIEGSLKYSQEDYCIRAERNAGQCNLTDSQNGGIPLTVATDVGSVNIAFEE